MLSINGINFDSGITSKSVYPIGLCQAVIYHSPTSIICETNTVSNLLNTSTITITNNIGTSIGKYTCNGDAIVVDP